MTEDNEATTECTATPRLLLTYVAAGEVMSVSERTVREMVTQGQLPCVTIGRTGKRIPVRAIEQWIEQNQRFVNGEHLQTA